MEIHDDYMVTLHEIVEETRMAPDEETGEMILAPSYFSSMPAMIAGARSMIDFFDRIHGEGKVYAGNDPLDFRFSLENGAMQVREDIRLLPMEEAFAVKELPLINEFLAPELVEAYVLPEEDRNFMYCFETDRYFVSVFLFEYFFHTGSPFEGKRMVNRCFLSPLEKEQFRTENGQFCMDEGEHDNGPVKGIQDKLIRYWAEYPEILHKCFYRAFMNGGTMWNLRPTEIDWKNVLTRLTLEYKQCKCGFHGFAYKLSAEPTGVYSCPGCGKPFYALINGMDRILLSEGEKLYECQTGKNLFDTETVTGLIVENSKRKGLYGIKNVSNGCWRGLYPDNSTREIENGQVIPIWSGMTIRFVTGEDWFIRQAVPVVEKEEDDE